MEFVERAAVADADDDALRQFAFQGAVEQGFGRFVQGGGSFVEQDDFGPREQGTDEGDALQFARGELVLPVVGFVQFVNQILQAAGTHGFDEFRMLFVDVGVTNRVAQAALRRVGALRQEKDVLLRRMVDFAATAKRPKTCQRAKQGSLAATARAAYQQGIAAFKVDVDAVQ